MKNEGKNKKVEKYIKNRCNGKKEWHIEQSITI